MISPADFIPVAEETGLIGEIGEWVLKQACTEAASWPGDIHARGQRLAGAVPRQDAGAARSQPRSRSQDLRPDGSSSRSPRAVLIRDDEEALTILQQLRELGVRIALDDFGTGYSSLSYLHRFPFDKIKIDRSFISDIGESGDSSIVQAVVHMAAARHMATTAEGVETEAQREVLRQLGCSQMQGWLFSPAVPAAKLQQLLLSRSSDAA